VDGADPPGCPSRYRVRVRWDALFDDLAAQLAAAERAELADAVADLTRAEHATVSLVERLRGTEGVVTLELRDGSRVTGEVRDVATDWVLVEEQQRQHLVPSAAVAAVTGLGRFARPATSGRAERLGLGHVLRALMRDRRPVQVRVHTAAYPGWISRVGKDHVDLEVSPGARHGTRSVPYAALLCVSDSWPGGAAR
jgi:sRNA-binding regulator protein Hfq